MNRYQHNSLKNHIDHYLFVHIYGGKGMTFSLSTRGKLHQHELVQSFSEATHHNSYSNFSKLIRKQGRAKEKKEYMSGEDSVPDQTFNISSQCALYSGKKHVLIILFMSCLHSFLRHSTYRQQLEVGNHQASRPKQNQAKLVQTLWSCHQRTIPTIKNARRCSFSDLRTKKKSKIIAACIETMCV